MSLANLILVLVASVLTVLFFVIVPPVSLSAHPGGKNILKSPISIFVAGGTIMLLGLLLLR
ncbi:MAG: hypothetical protein GXO73_01530 [Calditrichaeota bacterium]|nr:hypothetical protein [Calditrichota bacterium]